METVSTDIAQLCFDRTTAILYVKINEDVHMDLIKTMHHFKIIKKLTKGERYYAMIDGSNYFTADEDALSHAALEETSGACITCAFYSLNLANRLTIHFFNLLHKPAFPITIYRTKEAALNCIVETQKNDLVS